MDVMIEEFCGDIDKAGVEDLVNYFGLGKTASEALAGLGCLTVNDLKKIKPNTLTRYTTQAAARRIMLLKKYAVLRWP